MRVQPSQLMPLVSTSLARETSLYPASLSGVVVAASLGDPGFPRLEVLSHLLMNMLVEGCGRKKKALLTALSSCETAFRASADCGLRYYPYFTLN